MERPPDAPETGTQATEDDEHRYRERIAQAEVALRELKASVRAAELERENTQLRKERDRLLAMLDYVETFDPQMHEDARIHADMTPGEKGE